MAAEDSFAQRRKSKSLRFMTLLSSAACEWLLMFLLFVDAALSYFVTKFADYCELKPPCMLCSRLHHAKKKPGNYWNSLCKNHREEVSSLISCCVHNTLADVHEMCEECLVPIAHQNKLNSESYRRACSCCKKTWRVKSNTERLLDFNSLGFGASKANVKPPLPRVSGRSRFSRKDSLRRLRDKFMGPVRTRSAGSNIYDSSSNDGYTKMKMYSDTESEVPFSEDENGKWDTKSECDFAASEKRINRGSEVKSLILQPPNLSNSSDRKSVNSSLSDTFMEKGRREFDGEKSYAKPTPILMEDLISLEVAPQKSINVVETGENTNIEEDAKPKSVFPLRNYRRNDSGYESDDISVGDIEGESMFDRLKRQIEHDRTCMDSLYKELEEERNASAIAANQAMAMITRLQEEKAALRTEALQYLRMMDEQAEYDMEALEKANDLIAEKERELLEVEAEFESYRERFVDALAMENPQRETLKVDNCVNSHVENGNRKPSKSLEKKMVRYVNGVMNVVQMSNGGLNCEKIENGVHDFEDLPNGLLVEKVNGHEFVGEKIEILPMPRIGVGMNFRNHEREIDEHASKFH